MGKLSQRTISTGGRGLPSRMILHGCEKVGKSSFAASFAEKPIFAMTKNETGLETLIENNLVDPTAHFDVFTDWADLIQTIDELIVDTELPYKTFVLDTLNGAQELCFDYVTKKHFKNSREAFVAWGKGPGDGGTRVDRAIGRLGSSPRDSPDGIILLRPPALNQANSRNPRSEDSRPAINTTCTRSFWGLIHKWADIILFANHVDSGGS